MGGEDRGDGKVEELDAHEAQTGHPLVEVCKHGKLNVGDFAEFLEKQADEKAEGGDMLAVRARENPAFLGGFSRVCDGAGLALYRRKAVTAASLQNPRFSVSR